MQSVLAVERRVKSLLDKGWRPVLVALDGHSAAGKSTLASALASQLAAVVVHGDDFYMDMPEAERLALSPSEGVDRYFDWQRMRDEALLPLSAGRRATFRRFDWVQGTGMTAPVMIDPAAVVVVDGVYSARPEFDELFELRILVEATSDVREHRRRFRHDAHWQARWDAAERIYFASVRPRESFDLIVSGQEEVP